MVKKTKDTPAVTGFDRRKLLNGMLKDVRKQIGSSNFADSAYSKVSQWFDSGDIMLNALCGGSIKRGYPSGRTILLAGESQSGKTLFIIRALSQAIAAGKVDHIFWFDSEGGAGEDMLSNFGVPLEQVEFIPPLISIEDAATKIIAVFERIAAIRREEQDLINKGEMTEEDRLKFIMVLDSLGALVGEKFFNDAEKAANARTKAIEDGKDPMDVGGPAQDMGAEAKLINKLMKAATQRALLTDTLFFVVNHIIDNPSPFGASKIRCQRGGKGIGYMCRIGIQLTKGLEKDAEGKTNATAGYFKGNLLNAFTIKNSFARPFLDVGTYIDFSKGPIKYYGAFDFAVSEDVGLIVKGKPGWYIVPGYSETKQFREDDLRYATNGGNEAWEAILDKLDEVVQRKFAYSSESEILEAEAMIEADMNAVGDDGSIIVQ